MKLSNRRFIGDVNKIELSMTAMIDVVFLLLIFFLVTTTFVPPEFRRTCHPGISLNLICNLP
jgi:biopolymer transport protein ExbD